jgi:hypothetical protein
MKVILILIVVFLGALFFIYTGGNNEALTDSEMQAVLAYSEPIADNLFDSLTANDYAGFSRDFDSYMLETTSANNFTEWKLNLDDKLGKYISRQVDQITESDEYHVVVYQVEFEKDPQAKVRIVFHTAAPHAINNFWIESDHFSE